MKNRDEASTVRALKKNRDVNVNEGDKFISVKKDSPLVGNGTYGKIDFLVHYCGYVMRFTDDKSIKRAVNADADSVVSKKKTKKETKQANQIKLAKDVKQVFKKKFNKVK